MDINDIRVYDPRTDGIDAKTYLKIKRYLEKFNSKVFYIFHDGLQEKVLGSEIGKGITLRDFLLNINGYLTTKKGENAVVFIDGKFHSEYNGNEFTLLDLDELIEKTNSVPFAFAYNPSDHDYSFKE